MKSVKQIVANVEEKPILQAIALAAIVLLGTVLRFYKLGAWGFWIDEIFTVNASPYIADWPVARVPIYLILTEIAKGIWGATEWSARLFPALIGSLTLLLLYFPIRRLFGPLVALLSILLLAVAPWHIFWSQNARFYALMALFYALGLLYLLIGLLEGRRWLLVLAVLCLLLAVREKTSALIFIPGVAGYFLTWQLLFPHEKWRLRPHHWLILLIPILAFALFQIGQYLVTGHAEIQTLLAVFGGQTNHSPVRLMANIAWRLGLVVVVLGFFSGLYGSWQKNRAVLFIFWAALTPVVTLAAATPFAFTVDRYAFVALPFWLILCALAVKELWDKQPEQSWLLPLAIGIILVVVPMGDNWLYYSEQNGGRPDWRSALAYVSARMSDDDQVYVSWPEIGHHYLDDSVQYINAFAADEINPPTQRIWFVIDEATGYTEPQVAQWLGQYTHLEEIVIVRLPGKSLDMRVYLYEPSRFGE